MFRGTSGLAIALAASIVIACALIGAVMIALSPSRQTARIQPTTSQKSLIVILPIPNLPEQMISSQAVFSAGDAFVGVAEHPLSQFSVNTDISCYQELRDALMAGRLPDPKSVRIEGLINAFSYEMPSPAGSATFAAKIEVGPCPWEAGHRLARVALRAKDGAEIVADDVRAQVTFNPASVQSEKLIGYDRAGGETQQNSGQSVEGGHAVTVLYEVVPAAMARADTELLTLRVRYRAAGSTHDQLFEASAAFPAEGLTASADQRFASAVARLGMLLKQGTKPNPQALDGVVALAGSGIGSDPDKQRQEFLLLIRQIRSMVG